MSLSNYRDIFNIYIKVLCYDNNGFVVPSALTPIQQTTLAPFFLFNNNDMQSGYVFGIKSFDQTKIQYKGLTQVVAYEEPTQTPAAAAATASITTEIEPNITDDNGSIGDVVLKYDASNIGLTYVKVIISCRERPYISLLNATTRTIFTTNYILYNTQNPAQYTYPILLFTQNLKGAYKYETFNPLTGKTIDQSQNDQLKMNLKFLVNPFTGLYSYIALKTFEMYWQFNITYK